MKENMKKLPQIDAQFEHNQTTKYANELLDRLLSELTLNQIALHSGICRRSLSYMRHRGILNFPHQLALEVLANVRTIQ